MQNTLGILIAPRGQKGVKNEILEQKGETLGFGRATYTGMQNNLRISIAPLGVGSGGQKGVKNEILQ